MPAARNTRSVRTAPKISTARTATKTPKTKETPAMLEVVLNPPAHTRPAPQLFGWGSPGDGALGLEAIPLDWIYKPARNKWVEQQMAEPNNLFGPRGAGFEDVAAGGVHTLLIDETGRIWSCGANDNAALGRQTTSDEDASVLGLVESLSPETFRAVKIAAGGSVSAAISDRGEFRAWGSFRASSGPLGFSTSSEKQFLPAQIPRLEKVKVTAVAAGENFLLILTEAGDVLSMGVGEEGQLGRRVVERKKILGTLPEKVVLEQPKRDGRPKRTAVVIGAGANHAFAVDNEGVVWSWGINGSGQTGTGVEDRDRDKVVYTPRRVIGMSKAELNGDVVVQIAGGQQHTLFLTSNGSVYACGLSFDGELGLARDHPALASPTRPFEDFVAEPTLVAFPHDERIAKIACGTHCSFAVAKSGAMYSWGRQVTGELGLGEQYDGKDHNAWTPTVVVRREGGSWSAVAVACGGQHGVALFRKKV